VEIPFEQNLRQALDDRILKGLLERLQKEWQQKGDLNFNGPGGRREHIKLPNKAPENFNQRKTPGRPKEEKGTAPPLQNRDATRPVPPPSPPPRPSGAAMPQLAPAPATPLPEDDTLARWTRDLLDRARESEYGEMVMQSPTLRQGLEELRKALLTKGDGGQFQAAPPGALAGLAEKLRQKNLPKLPDLSWMKPQALFSSQPNVRLPSVNISPAVPRLALGLPRWGGSGPTGRMLGSGLLWIGVVALAALVCWQILRRWSGTGGTRARRARALGPWPVEPGKVMTPADLILAFEYLSLLRLGPDSRSWNHRLIAANLCARQRDDEPWCRAAEELAALYERARYAPATDLLPESALASARHDLCLLAGVASA
jgi:hypothetical protein